MTEIAEIARAALNLPLSQRVSLAQSLLDSLPPEAEDGSEATELEEAERREHEMETGQVKPISEAELWQRVKDRRRA